MHALVTIVLLMTWSLAAAAEHVPATPAEHGEHATTTQGHAAAAANEAVLPPVGIRWPAVLMMVVLGMFASAAVIGWFASLLMTEEEPPPVAAAHDDHGHGHDHGHAGHH
jgi:hypothetical protein